MGEPLRHARRGAGAAARARQAHPLAGRAADLLPRGLTTANCSRGPTPVPGTGVRGSDKSVPICSPHLRLRTRAATVERRVGCSQRPRRPAVLVGLECLVLRRIAGWDAAARDAFACAPRRATYPAGVSPAMRRPTSSMARAIDRPRTRRPSYMTTMRSFELEDLVEVLADQQHRDPALGGVDEMRVHRLDRRRRRAPASARRRPAPSGRARTRGRGRSSAGSRPTASPPARRARTS